MRSVDHFVSLAPGADETDPLRQFLFFLAFGFFFGSHSARAVLVPGTVVDLSERPIVFPVLPPELSPRMLPVVPSVTLPRSGKVGFVLGAPPVTAGVVPPRPESVEV